MTISVRYVGCWVISSDRDGNPYPVNNRAGIEGHDRKNAVAATSNWMTGRAKLGEESIKRSPLLQSSKLEGTLKFATLDLTDELADAHDCSGLTSV